MTTYYHGGYGHLLPGQLVLPPCETGAPSTSDYGGEKVHRRDRVYLTTVPEGALIWAALYHGVPAVYEVEPIGELEPDPDCSEPGLSWQVPRARVVRRLDISVDLLMEARKALLDDMKERP